MHPKVSVIIPVYNVEKYLEDALTSVFKQDYNNMEVIVIDDGSTDNCSGIISQFKSMFKFVHYYQKNSGLSSARNKGIEIATGEYVIFFDSDDVMPSGTITKCVSELTKSNASIVFFNASCINEEGDPLISSFYTRPRKLLSSFDMSGYDFMKISLEEKAYIVSACLYMVRNEIIGNLRFPQGIIHEDNFFTTMLLLNENIRVKTISDVCFFRRVRYGSIMSAQFSKKNVDGYLFSIDFFSNYLLKLPSSNAVVLSSYVRELVYACVSSYMKSDFYLLRFRSRILLLEAFFKLNKVHRTFELFVLSTIPDIARLFHLSTSFKGVYLKWKHRKHQ